MTKKALTYFFARFTRKKEGEAVRFAHKRSECEMPYAFFVMY